MILSCPACETQYFADDASVGRVGREVKCVACGHAWFVPAVQGEAQPGNGAGGHERYLEMVRLRRRRRARHVAIAAWLIGAGTFAGGAAYAVLARDRVVTAWPEAASAYRQLGLEVNRFGLDFENIQRSRELDGTTPVFWVSADLRNITSRARAAPDVRVGLLDEFDRELAFLIADVDPDIIAPGEAGKFRASLENPPADAYRLDLRFQVRDKATGAEAGQATTRTGSVADPSETLAANGKAGE